MNKLKFKLNYKGVGELLKSPELETILKKEAQEIAARAGEGYVAETRTAPTRNFAKVYAKTKKAKRDNNKNNTLLKAVHK